MNGSEIKKVRKKHRLTQRDLACKLKVSQATVSFWEKGRMSPKPPLLAKIQKLSDKPAPKKKKSAAKA